MSKAEASNKAIVDLAKDVIDKHQDDKEKAATTLENLAQAAEAAERYDDMVVMMQHLVKLQTEQKEELSPDQRNLLSVAYKNVVGAKRSSWRVLSDDHQVLGQEESADAKQLLAKYKKVVEAELEKVCHQVLEELKTLEKQNNDRLEQAKSEEDEKKNHECQVFYLKMIGDYYRYLTEAFKTNEDYKKQCNEYYQKAMNMAVKKLEATHPTRLGLALNYSVCFYEILEQPSKACELAKSAFDEAIEKLDSLNDVSYKDSTLIMQLLRDNLTIWNQSSSDKPEETAN